MSQLTKIYRSLFICIWLQTVSWRFLSNLRGSPGFQNKSEFYNKSSHKFMDEDCLELTPHYLLVRCNQGITILLILLSSAESVAALLDLMYRDPSVGAVCARTYPLGSGPLYWYQVFDYAIGHWLQKVRFRCIHFHLKGIWVPWFVKSDRMWIDILLKSSIWLHNRALVPDSRFYWHLIYSMSRGYGLLSFATKWTLTHIAFGLGPVLVFIQLWFCCRRHAKHLFYHLRQENVLLWIYPFTI